MSVKRNELPEMERISLIAKDSLQAPTDTDSGASEGGFGSRIVTDADSGASVQ